MRKVKSIYELYKQDGHTFMRVIKQKLWFKRVTEYQKLNALTWLNLTNKSITAEAESIKLTAIEQSLKNEHKI